MKAAAFGHGRILIEHRYIIQYYAVVGTYVYITESAGAIQYLIARLWLVDSNIIECFAGGG